MLKLESATQSLSTTSICPWLRPMELSPLLNSSDCSSIAMVFMRELSGSGRQSETQLLSAQLPHLLEVVHPCASASLPTSTCSACQKLLKASLPLFSETFWVASSRHLTLQRMSKTSKTASFQAQLKSMRRFQRNFVLRHLNSTTRSTCVM